MKIEVLKAKFEGIFQKKIKYIYPLAFEDKEGITGKASLSKPSIYKFQIGFEQGECLDVVCKFKSRQVIGNGIKLLNHDRDLKFLYLLLTRHKILGFDRSHIRELTFYCKIGQGLRQHLIPSWGIFRNDIKDQYMILMEEVKLEKTWDKAKIYDILDSIFPFHQAFYQKPEAVKDLGLNYYRNADYKRSRPLFRHMFDKFGEENKKFFSLGQIRQIVDFIDKIHLYHAGVKDHASLTHNDFNLRNIFYNQEQILIYDWELACFQNPEHDIIEFLVFILQDLEDEEVLAILRYYKHKAYQALGLNFSALAYQAILSFNLMEYIVNKLSLYRLANQTLKLDFVDQMCINSRRLLDLLREEEV